MTRKMLKKEYLQLVLLLILFTILYISFRSISYDDWDSIQFALGIENFDMALHQPHPPGYPVYIFMLKGLNLLFNNPLNSMIFLSITSSITGLITFYFIVKTILPKNRYLPIISTTILAIFPLYALNSVKAMSDIFSLTFYLIWLLYFLKITVTKEHKVSNYIFLGIISGISLGIRIQIITAMLLPLVILTIYLFKDLNKYTKQLVSLIASGILSTLIWLVASIIASGGLSRYYELLKGQYVWRYAIHAHTPFEQGFNIQYFFQHGFSHIYSFIQGGLGISLPWSSVSDIPSVIMTVLITLTSFIIFYLLYILLKKRKNQIVNTFFISAVPYLIFMYFNLNFENARYWLPFIPWLIILFVMWINKIEKKSLRNIVLGILILFLSFQSYTLLNILHTQPSPPTSIIEFLQPTKESTAFINCAHNNERHFQYLTDYEIEFIEEYDKESLLEIQNRELDIISCQCWKPLEIDGISIIDRFNFYRDPKVHWKHSYIEICSIRVE